jgi:hypothetical protein
MARFASGGLTTAGSTTLPITSLYSATTGRPWLAKLGLWNTTATAVTLRLVRLSTAGTRPSAWAAAQLSQEDGSVAAALAYGTHTVAPTISLDLGYRWVLGAAIGAGVIETWPERVLTLSSTANNGLGVVVENGTGQACQVYWEWGE